MKILTLCSKCAEVYSTGGYKVSALKFRTTTEKKPKCEYCGQRIRDGLAIAATKIPAEEAIDILESCLYTACESCPKCGNECEGERRVRIALDMAEEALERQIPIGPPAAVQEDEE